MVLKSSFHKKMKSLPLALKATYKIFVFQISVSFNNTTIKFFSITGYATLPFTYFFTVAGLQCVAIILPRCRQQNFQFLIFIDPSPGFCAKSGFVTSFWEVIDNYIRTRDKGLFEGSSVLNTLFRLSCLKFVSFA